MKKTLVAALAAALTVGAASTTFAAANPFSDVPRDHWAYDAVTQLAADGVIEGYGDGTYRGDRNITRYEMAQMVARAMAKNDMSASDRALLDRLAAEFADELNNLGVRVSNLERNADMVKWNGLLRYTYTSERKDGQARDNRNRLRLRLLPTAEINEHWKVKARLQADTYMNTDAGRGNSDKVTVDRLYADGTYGNFNAQVGKMSLFSEVDQGLVFDGAFSGAQLTFNSPVKVKLLAGRLKDDHVSGAADIAANYQGIELTHVAGPFNVGLGYHHLNSQYFHNTAYHSSGNKDNANIWAVGAGYAFDKNVKLFAAYAKNTDSNANRLDHAYNIELSYKGVKKTDPGSWGLTLGYRYMGDYASLIPSYSAGMYGYKGWEAVAAYAFAKNITGKVAYFDGKRLADTSQKGKKLFAEFDFSF